MSASEGYEPEYYEFLRTLEGENFWFRSRNALILWAIEKYFPSAQSFLEIGCGTGYVLSGVAKKFPNLRLAGSEVLIAGLTVAAERTPEAFFCQLDARQLPFVNEYDLIGAFDVIEHIDDDSAVLKQMHRAARPNGGVILTVPQHRWLWSAADDYSHHVRRYGAKELENKLRAAGFDVLRSTSFVSVLLPAMIYSRLGKHRGDKPYDPADEFRISPFMNRLLEGFLTLERALIRWGVNFSVGGSRLIIARKDIRQN